jgi:uncharacterized protein YjbI with pentapeptide repeats
MSNNNQLQTHPSITRENVETLLAIAGSPKKLDLSGQNLSQINLSDLNLNGANLSRTDLSGANLRGVDLHNADLRGANLHGADLTYIKLRSTNLQRANLSRANLSGANLNGSYLSRINLSSANLCDATLSGADLRGTNLSGADLSGANLRHTNLTKANLPTANLSGVNLLKANLNGADLSGANLQNTNLSSAKLNEANLTNVNFADSNAVGPELVDVFWGDTNLNIVKWFQIKILGDEQEANQKLRETIFTKELKKKTRKIREEDYYCAARAYRQLSVALKAQGINEGNEFAFRAQLMQRKSLWFALTSKDVKPLTRFSLFGKLLFSWFLFLIAGYGYRISHAFASYAAIVTIFALIYLSSTSANLLEAIVASINALHGRAVTSNISTAIGQNDGLLLATGVEAVIGLIVEITFIAAITQRFFNK